MKRNRAILISATSLVVLVLLVVAGLFTSTFQTWALRRVLAERSDQRIEFARVSISLGSVSIEDLKWEKDGAVLQLPFLRADFPVFAALKGRLELESLSARGWRLDLRRYALPELGPLAAAANSPQQANAAVAFAGIFPLLRLPVDFSLAKVDLEGEMIFPAAQAGQTVHSRVSLSGGELGMGKEGRIQLELSGEFAGGVPVREIKVRSHLLLGMDTPRSISSVSCEMLAEARGPQFPEGARLQMAARAQQKQGTEVYSLELRREQVSLLSLEARLAKPNGALEGRWVVKTSDVDFAPFALGHGLPSFELSGQGLFAVVLPGDTLQLTGDLAMRADRLGLIDARLAALGAVSTQASFDLVSAKEYLRVRRLKVAVRAPEPVAELEALQGFELLYNGFELRLSDPAKHLLRVHASALPVAWLAPFAAGSELKGGVLSGEWTWASHASGFSLLSTREAQVDGVSFSREGKALVEGLDMAANFRIDYLQGGWQVDLAGLKLEKARQRVAEFHLKLGQRKGEAQAVVFQGGGKIRMPGLLEQPLFASLGKLDEGNINIEFKGSVAESSECHFKLLAEGMVREGAALPNASLEVRGTLAPDGVFSFTAPLQMDNQRLGRVSDLSLEGTLQATRSPVKVEAKLHGRVISFEDLQSLAALLKTSPQPVSKASPRLSTGTKFKSADGAPSAAPGGEPERVPDPAAVWSVVEGRIQVALGRLLLNSSSELVEVKANLELTPQELRLDQVRARGENGTTLAFDASLYFEGGQTPYSLQAQFKANAFDVSGFTSSTDAFSPTLTTKFDINSKLKGRGATLDDLFQHSTGNFQLLSRGGKCRLLRSDITEFLQGKSSIGNLFMGSITSILSSKREKELEDVDGGKLDEYSKIAMELAAYFAEVPFDQLSVSLERDPELNLRLQDFAMISPMLRLTGAGLITHQAGKAFADQPMELQLQLAARGRIAELFGKANMLAANKDNLGYQALNQPVQVRGTLGRPDSSEFKELLRKVTQQKAEAFLERLIGGGR